jgi:pilus assembly protein Flp/PilA
LIAGLYARAKNCSHSSLEGIEERKARAMRHLIMRFRNDQSAATAIEYGLIAAGISVAIIAVVLGIGTNLNTTFGDVSSAVK